MADQSHVFISYSRKDHDVLHRVKQSLDAAGIPNWTDEHIEPGTRSWRRAIEKAIREAGCLVCILSPDAVESYWVEQELVFAENLHKPIQLLLARGDETNAVPFGYGTYQWIDLRTNYEEGIRRLLPVLRPIFGPAQPDRILTLEEAPVDYRQIKAVTRNADWTPIIRVINGIEMCLVPPGCFMMGSEEIADAQPVHQCCFDKPFWIGRYPVTNAQYIQAVEAGVCKVSRYADDARFNQPQQPVAGVTWYESWKFAEWMEMRLLTEMEWEYAARGPENWLWPWENEFVAENLVYQENSTGQTAIVGSRPGGASWVGALDLSGNVREWCQTKWRESYSEPENNDPQGDEERVLRGGSWNLNLLFAHCAFRDSRNPDLGYNAFGFRVARATDATL